MLVVNGVKLVVLNESQQVRELEGDDPRGLEDGLETGYEVIDVGHVGENVAPEKEVGGDAVGNEFFRGLDPEEFHDTGNLLLLPSDLGDVAAGSTPSTGIPFALKC